ncbi:MAG: hypothetical protein V3S55_09650 [Nitrospiraceae bacterium]
MTDVSPRTLDSETYVDLERAVGICESMPPSDLRKLGEIMVLCADAVANQMAAGTDAKDGER